MSEREMLERVCVGLGATSAQAGPMAEQLIKRADQIAIDRSISREEAMRYLLELVTKGRAGEVSTDYDRVRPPIPRDPAK